MREAVSLAPENPEVKAAFDKIQSDDSINVLVRLCRRFSQENDLEAGKEALRYLNGNRAEISESGSGECISLIVGKDDGGEASIQDDIASLLLQKYPGAKAYLAKRLEGSVTDAFREVYNIGDGSANGMVNVVLDPTPWSTKSTREVCERDVFQLFVAKLMETGHDHDGRALKGIARLLAAGAERLQSLIDEDVFDSFLTSLDNQLPTGIRSQATLATVRFLDVSKETGQVYLSRFITTRVARQTNDDLVLAFSVAAAIFPLVPSVASALFLTDGFVPSLQPLLQKKAKSARVEQAALEMLNAACIDSACREAISKYCLDWLHNTMEVREDERQGLAAVILAKVISVPSTGNTQSQSSQQGHHESDDDLDMDVVPMLRKLLLDEDKVGRPNAVEGLAYASIQPRIKENLIKDLKFVKAILTLPEKDLTNTTSFFGVLTLIDNLSRYLLNLSEEQKRMNQLRAYANASKNPTQTDPFDEDEYVTKRCAVLIQSGVIPCLIGIHKTLASLQLSQASLKLLANILLALSKASASRGTIAQQGGIPLLLQIYKSLGSDPENNGSRQITAHALARILISVNPKLAFGSRSPLSAVPPLLSLINDESSAIGEGPRDLLPVFEGLLALTNLVSDISLGTTAEVVRSAFDQIEALLLSNNAFIQRAATELVCNLMASPEGIEKFADGSKQAARRLHILIALTDVHDVSTRRAASGGLSMITEFEAAVKAIEERERGVENLMRLLQDEDEGCVHRAIVCIQNIMVADGETGKKGREMIKGLNGVEVLKSLIETTKNEYVAKSGLGALEVLISYVPINVPVGWEMIRPSN